MPPTIDQIAQVVVLGAFIGTLLALLFWKLTSVSVEAIAGAIRSVIRARGRRRRAAQRLEV